MALSVRVDVHQAQMEAGMRAGGLRFMNRYAERVTTRARVLAPVDTGRLRQSIGWRLQLGRHRVTGVIEARASYAVYVHEGTGIYGPSGSPIRPKSGKFLVFPARRGSSRGGRRLIFAREVKGQRANPFLVRALRAALPADFRIRLLNTRGS